MLTIQSKGTVSEPIEVFGTSPDALAPLSLDAIRRQKVFIGNRGESFGSIFEVSGDGGDRQQHWSGDLAGVSGIGYGMVDGVIRIEGDAGSQVGAADGRGGEIFVNGSVGHYPGCEINGGLIHIAGDAGDGVGGAWSGTQTGQTGGTICVGGRAGNGVGQLMRRGLIAIGGDSGNCCGYLMHAGTIVIGGQTGRNTGAEMQRGTIIVSGGSGLPGPGFVSGGLHRMPITALLERYLRESGMELSLAGRLYHVYHGDRLHGARGELLVATD